MNMFKLVGKPGCSDVYGHPTGMYNGVIDGLQFVVNYVVTLNCQSLLTGIRLGIMHTHLIKLCISFVN